MPGTSDRMTCNGGGVRNWAAIENAARNGADRRYFDNDSQNGSRKQSNLHISLPKRSVRLVVGQYPTHNTWYVDYACSTMGALVCTDLTKNKITNQVSPAACPLAPNLGIEQER